jgi:ribosome-binding factor A
MDATRLQKVQRLIQKELSAVFQKKNDIFLRTLISVTEVRVTDDLDYARVFVSIFPNERKDEVMSLIEINKKQLRYELAQNIKNQLRKTPDLSFFIDESLDYAEKIDKLLQ